MFLSVLADQYECIFMVTTGTGLNAESDSSASGTLSGSEGSFEVQIKEGVLATAGR